MEVALACNEDVFCNQFDLMSLKNIFDARHAITAHPSPENTDCVKAFAVEFRWVPNSI